MNRATHPPESRDPEELERDIDRTRSSLGRTIDELENRLSPGQLIDQALSMGRRHGGEFAANLGRSVENNPLPLLLTAVGIAWMMMSSNERRPGRRVGVDAWEDYEATDSGGRLEGAKERLQGGIESARSAASSVGERAAHAKHAIGDTVSHTGERMRYAGQRVRVQSGRMREGFARLLEEQPLLVGAIGLAVGAAIGAAMPRTESEDRLLGETSDSAARRLKERAGEAYEEARERAADLLPGEDEDRGEEAGPGRTSIGSEHAAIPPHETGDFEPARRDH